MEYNGKFRVESSQDDGRIKVVEVVAILEGATGETEKRHVFSWEESERYTFSPAGKRVPKTGPDYKAEIARALESYYSPKVISPSQ